MHVTRHSFAGRLFFIGNCTIIRTSAFGEEDSAAIPSCVTARPALPARAREPRKREAGAVSPVGRRRYRHFEFRMIELKLDSHSIPTATYRLQLPRHLRFDDARELAPYLAQLGIGAAYTSPFLRACEGSSHGYDVVDHGQVDPTLGTVEDFGSFAEALARHGLGLVVDIVPNHMGISDPHNGWWQDVLVNGPASTYARYFDIDWQPPKEALHNRVLLPVLGDQFGKVLEEQQLRLAYEAPAVRHRLLRPSLSHRSGHLGADSEAGARAGFRRAGV